MKGGSIGELHAPAILLLEAEITGPDSGPQFLMLPELRATPALKVPDRFEDLYCLGIVGLQVITATYQNKSENEL